MTEFEKWWAERLKIGDLPADLSETKAFAEKTWHAAQRRIIGTISEPPYMPKVGEKIRYLGLCHPRTLGKVKEVTEVTEHIIKATWVESKWIENGEELYSGGILGEVEKADGA